MYNFFLTVRNVHREFRRTSTGHLCLRVDSPVSLKREDNGTGGEKG